MNQVLRKCQICNTEQYDAIVLQCGDVLCRKCAQLNQACPKCKQSLQVFSQSPRNTTVATLSNSFSRHSFDLTTHKISTIKKPLQLLDYIYAPALMHPVLVQIISPYKSSKYIVDHNYPNPIITSEKKQINGTAQRNSFDLCLNHMTVMSSCKKKLKELGHLKDPFKIHSFETQHSCKVIQPHINAYCFWKDKLFYAFKNSIFTYFLLNQKISQNPEIIISVPYTSIVLAANDKLLCALVTNVNSNDETICGHNVKLHKLYTTIVTLNSSFSLKNGLLDPGITVIKTNVFIFGGRLTGENKGAWNKAIIVYDTINKSISHLVPNLKFSRNSPIGFIHKNSELLIIGGTQPAKTSCHFIEILDLKKPDLPLKYITLQNYCSYSRLLYAYEDEKTKSIKLCFMDTTTDNAAAKAAIYRLSLSTHCIYEYWRKEYKRILPNYICCYNEKQYEIQQVYNQITPKEITY